MSPKPSFDTYRSPRNIRTLHLMVHLFGNCLMFQGQDLPNVFYQDGKYPKLGDIKLSVKYGISYLDRASCGEKVVMMNKRL